MGQEPQGWRVNEETEKGKKMKSEVIPSALMRSIVKRGSGKKRVESVKTNSKQIKPKEKCCCICGFKGTIDYHHDGTVSKVETYPLCPNHHALISRGKTTLAELLAKKNRG